MQTSFATNQQYRKAYRLTFGLLIVIGILTVAAASRLSGPVDDTETVGSGQPDLVEPSAQDVLAGKLEAFAEEVVSAEAMRKLTPSEDGAITLFQRDEPADSASPDDWFDNDFDPEVVLDQTDQVASSGKAGAFQFSDDESFEVALQHGAVYAVADHTGRVVILGASKDQPDEWEELTDDFRINYGERGVRIRDANVLNAVLARFKELHPPSARLCLLLTTELDYLVYRSQVDYCDQQATAYRPELTTIGSLRDNGNCGVDFIVESIR